MVLSVKLKKISATSIKKRRSIEEEGDTLLRKIFSVFCFISTEKFREGFDAIQKGLKSNWCLLPRCRKQPTQYWLHLLHTGVAAPYTPSQDCTQQEHKHRGNLI